MAFQVLHYGPSDPRPAQFRPRQWISGFFLRSAVIVRLKPCFQLDWPGWHKFRV